MVGIGRGETWKLGSAMGCCPPLAIGREGRQPSLIAAASWRWTQQRLVGVVSAIKANTVDFMVALDPAVLLGEAQGGGRRRGRLP